MYDENKEPEMRNVLLAVTGLSPQILTETLYYYSVVSKPPVTFDEIRVITTSAGKKLIEELLLDPEKGHYHRFCRDYGVNGVRFDQSCIEIIGGNKPLDDIRTEEDNGRMAAQVLKSVQRLTDDPSVALYCSIAGGRKTMGAYLSLALQLYGRNQDHLSHVLVTPEFEYSREFFYKPPNETTIRGRDPNGNPIELHTRDAKIELASIPFVSVRKYLPRDKQFPLDAMIQSMQQSIEGRRAPTTIHLDIKQKKLRISDAVMELSPDLRTIYAFFLATKSNCKKKNCAECTKCFITLNDLTTNAAAGRILELYKRAVGIFSANYEKREKQWTKKLPDEDYFIQTISKINKALYRNVSEYDYPLVEIDRVGGYHDRRYGVKLDKTHINLKGS